MTHISMALVAVGLLVLAGRRRDADAWRWRGAVAAGVAGWALLWGPSFLVQSRGGHSSWIPHTTPARFLATISSLVTSRPGISVLVVAAVVAGAIVCVRRDRNLAMVLVCCSAIPALLAGLLGLRAPVLVEPHADGRRVGPAPRDRLPRRRRVPASPRRGHGRGRRCRTPHARLGSGRPERSRTNSRAHRARSGRATRRRDRDPTTLEGRRALLDHRCAQRRRAGTSGADQGHPRRSCTRADGRATDGTNLAHATLETADRLARLPPVRTHLARRGVADAVHSSPVHARLSARHAAEHRRDLRRVRAPSRARSSTTKVAGRGYRS